MLKKKRMGFKVSKPQGPTIHRISTSHSHRNLLDTKLQSNYSFIIYTRLVEKNPRNAHPDNKHSNSHSS
jgi:hypothetical protein